MLVCEQFLKLCTTYYRKLSAFLPVGQNVQTNLIHEPEPFGFDEFQDIIGCDYNLKIISLRFHL